MCRIFFLMTFCAIHLLLLSSQPLCVAEEFQPLFNGKDLTGWVLTNTPPETWTFQEGMLVCTGRPIGEIRTEKMYQNFVMELEWRHMVPGGNAGIFVWADDITSRGVPFHRGIEVQVLENAYGNSKSHTTHGDIFPIHGATMTPYNGRGGSRAFPTESRSKPSPEWNHYRIECRDGEISLAVNGKVVTRGKDCVPRKGYICLESEGGVVHYRNVRIQKLPPTDISPENVAIADRGYRSLYTGLNLNGWKAPDKESLWQVRDWILAFNGSKDAADTLTSTESFEDIGFVVDVRLKDVSCNVVISAGEACRIDLSDPRLSQYLEPPGRWNRFESNVKNGQRSLSINGSRVPSATATVENQTAALVLTANGAVEFSNVYARSGREPE